MELHNLCEDFRKNIILLIYHISLSRDGRKKKYYIVEVINLFSYDFIEVIIL